MQRCKIICANIPKGFVLEFATRQNKKDEKHSVLSRCKILESDWKHQNELLRVCLQSGVGIKVVKLVERSLY